MHSDDQGQDRSPKAGYLRPSVSQGLSSALLVLEQALRLFDIPSDCLGVRAFHSPLRP